MNISEFACLICNFAIISLWSFLILCVLPFFLLYYAFIFKACYVSLSSYSTSVVYASGFFRAFISFPKTNPSINALEKLFASLFAVLMTLLWWRWFFSLIEWIFNFNLELVLLLLLVMLLLLLITCVLLLLYGTLCQKAVLLLLSG